MRVSTFTTDEDAVSPVIGVILMVAVTVILAAVIGGFVLNLADGDDPAPQVRTTWSNESTGILLMHESGTDLNQENVDIKIRDGSGPTTLDMGTPTLSAGDTLYIYDTDLSSGTSWTVSSSKPSPSNVDDDAQPGVEVDLVWDSPESSQSSIVSSFTVN